MRSRSNTAVSTTSSILSSGPADMASYDHTSPDSPPALRHVGSHSRLDQTGPRRSIFRGRMGKRLSESIGTGVDIDEYQEADAGRKRASFLRKRKGTNEGETFQHELKSRISNPFDFQHLTHADRHQVAALEQASGSVLTAGWAERAAGLSGSGASGTPGVISPRNISTEHLEVSELNSVPIVSPRSPPHSPRLQSDWQQPKPSTGLSPSRPGLRLTRSVESFSQPGVNLRAHQHSSSVIAPPRTLSLLPTSPFQDIPEEGSSGYVSTATPAARSKRQSGVWDAFTLSTTAPADQLPGIEEDITHVGNAVTTPDDSAVQAMTPPFSPRLEDVAEEPERFVRPRPAPQPPRLRTPTSPKSPFLESFSFNQRSPGVRTHHRGNSHASPKSFKLKNLATRSSSQTSETLGSPDSLRESSIPRPSVARRKSNTWRAIEESWEDDVDYIYEHALEADCDNDWDCVSEDESFADRHHALALAIREDRPAVPRASQPLHPPISEDPMLQFQLPLSSSRLSPSNDSVPDLVPTSAASAFTTGASLQTPLHESEGFLLSPSLLLPQVYKDAEEASYEDILKEYVGSDCHFRIIDLDGSANSSARSSRVRFSRRSSYDSSLMSSAQSSGLLSSPIRRSASSAGSLPELVHSRRTRQNFSLVADELSEQVASLELFGSDDGEDDDITPPGVLRLSADRTFSTPTQDQSGNQSYQHNKRYHKQALSDSAAQLLTSTEPTKLRGRAATVSRTGGEEYLHLFPTPPSFSPPIVN
ncbi:hypothetical protein ST47_g9368 [Ascochyta rabiei]|uniref:Uncharacterized protein n=2 Tax=Didymella rabiei TaxID=5454 RepID=A0A162XFF9_DIDRA|nr:hypothetical protein ST47_g9368 [Ascochyta rabiei]